MYTYIKRSLGKNPNKSCPCIAYVLRNSKHNNTYIVVFPNHTRSKRIDDIGIPFTSIYFVGYSRSFYFIAFFDKNVIGVLFMFGRLF